MLLLAKLGWDVSGVTAFDFVDHLMERLDVSPRSSRQDIGVLRGHALTYVSLCCTGTEIHFNKFWLGMIFAVRKRGGCARAFNQSSAERESRWWCTTESSCFISLPLFYQSLSCVHTQNHHAKMSDENAGTIEYANERYFVCLDHNEAGAAQDGMLIERKSRRRSIVVYGGIASRQRKHAGIPPVDHQDVNILAPQQPWAAATAEMPH